MSYQEFTTLPPYERAVHEGGGFRPASEGRARWSNDQPPPAIGSRIEVTINRCGPADVTGYFVQDGFLGVLCDLVDPPEWHKVQNKGSTRGHAFGTEIRMAQAA